jgi:hypothetical protein
MSVCITGLRFNGKRLSFKPRRLKKLVFSHDNFDMIVESTDSTLSGDEPELRGDMLLALALAGLALMEFCKYVQVIFAKLFYIGLHTD